MMQPINIGGHVRFCGLLPTPEHIRRCFTPAKDRLKLIPETEWKEIDNWHFVKKTLDQDGQGSCVGFSGVQSLMIARARQGLPFVELSAGALYGSINDGYDQGAFIGDALTTLSMIGTCPASMIGQLDWKKARKSKDWHAEAAKYRIDEAIVCESAEEFCTGLQLGWDGVFGVAATNRFETDSEGYLPDTGSGINHAVTGLGMKKHPHTGKWYITGINSWGEDWGLKGKFFYPVNGTRGQDLWLVRSTIIA